MHSDLQSLLWQTPLTCPLLGPAQSLEAQLLLAKATSEQRDSALLRHRHRVLALAGSAAGVPVLAAEGRGPLKPAPATVQGPPALSMRQDMARRAACAAAVLSSNGSQACPLSPF